MTLPNLRDRVAGLKGADEIPVAIENVRAALTREQWNAAHARIREIYEASPLAVAMGNVQPPFGGGFTVRGMLGEAGVLALLALIDAKISEGAET